MLFRSVVDEALMSRNINNSRTVPVWKIKVCKAQINRDASSLFFLPSVCISSCQCLNQRRLAIVNNLLENWNSALGYYLNLNAVSENELQSALRNGNYQLALCPLRADNDGPWELLNLFSSENPYNPADYQNQDYRSEERRVGKE